MKRRCTRGQRNRTLLYDSLVKSSKDHNISCFGEPIREVFSAIDHLVARWDRDSHSGIQSKGRVVSDLQDFLLSREAGLSASKVNERVKYLLQIMRARILTKVTIAGLEYYQPQEMGFCGIVSLPAMGLLAILNEQPVHPAFVAALNERDGLRFAIQQLVEIKVLFDDHDRMGVSLQEGLAVCVEVKEGVKCETLCEIDSRSFSNNEFVELLVPYVASISNYQDMQMGLKNKMDYCNCLAETIREMQTVLSKREAEFRDCMRDIQYLEKGMLTLHKQLFG